MPKDKRHVSYGRRLADADAARDRELEKGGTHDDAVQVWVSAFAQCRGEFEPQSLGFEYAPKEDLPPETAADTMRAPIPADDLGEGEG